MSTTTVTAADLRPVDLFDDLDESELEEFAQRRANHVERLSEIRRRALRGGSRVVELVRQPGGHCAERRQPLAV